MPTTHEKVSAIVADLTAHGYASELPPSIMQVVSALTSEIDELKAKPAQDPEVAALKADVAALKTQFDGLMHSLSAAAAPAAPEAGSSAPKAAPAKA